MTRRARALVGTALLAFALATPLGGRAVGRACAAGNVHIAIVVDSGSGSSVSAVCVPAGERDNGATLLAARASMLGTPQPSFDGRSGLLCAIDGFPKTGCGQRNGGHYAYWAYFHGTGGKWEYSNIGPGGTRVNPAVVEGWRYQPDGAGLPTDPPPRGPATAGAICVPQTPTTTARPAASGTTAPHSGGTSPGVAPGTTAPVIGSPSPGTGAAGGVTTTATTTKTTTKNATGTTARGQTSTTVAGDARSASTSSSIALTSGGIAAGPGEESSGGIPVGAIVGVMLVVGLGAGGAVAARRRRRSAS